MLQMGTGEMLLGLTPLLAGPVPLVDVVVSQRKSRRRVESGLTMAVTSCLRRCYAITVERARLRD